MPHRRKDVIKPLVYTLILLATLLIYPFAGAASGSGQGSPAATEQIPPEILQQLLRQHSGQFSRAPEPFVPRIKGPYRIILAGFAVGVLFIGVLLCRNLRSYFDCANCIWLLFGLFGAIAALLIAAACIGSLFIHLAAGLCTVLSGFSIAAFLTPQFTLTRKWITGIKPLPSTNGEKS